MKDSQMVSAKCNNSKCNELRWPGCDDNLCPNHCQEEEKRKNEPKQQCWNCIRDEHAGPCGRP